MSIKRKKLIMGNKAYIKAIASHLPDHKLSNEDLAREYVDWDVDKIYSKTGISVRGVTSDDECASDLGVMAAKKLFAKGICQPDDIDFLLFCTQSPDYFLPTTACLMQERLGLRTNTGALDFSLGCSGYVYGLSLAKGLIETGVAGNVLLVTAETYTKYIHPKDRSARTIFGDGAAATLISGMESEKDLLGPFVFGTDGRGGKELIVPSGGRRKNPILNASDLEELESGVSRSPENLYMNGPEIFNFTLQSVPPLMNQILEKSGLTINDIDQYVFHQANRFMLERLRKKLKISEDKFCINLEQYGNTVSSTIPMALEIACQDGQVKPNDQVMLVGFGVGYSWAAALARII
jgi:3-oxoacyl-[acyl-carrier-protein] synthase-3